MLRQPRVPCGPYFLMRGARAQVLQRFASRDASSHSGEAGLEQFQRGKDMVDLIAMEMRPDREAQHGL
jgi:hypothetical protein